MDLRPRFELRPRVEHLPAVTDRAAGGNRSPGDLWGATRRTSARAVARGRIACAPSAVATGTSRPFGGSSHYVPRSARSKIRVSCAPPNRGFPRGARRLGTSRTTGVAPAGRSVARRAGEPLLRAHQRPVKPPAGAGVRTRGDGDGQQPRDVERSLRAPATPPGDICR